MPAAVALATGAQFRIPATLVEFGDIYVKGIRVGNTVGTVLACMGRNLSRLLREPVGIPRRRCALGRRSACLLPTLAERQELHALMITRNQHDARHEFSGQLGCPTSSLDRGEPIRVRAVRPAEGWWEIYAGLSNATTTRAMILHGVAAATFATTALYALAPWMVDPIRADQWTTREKVPGNSRLAWDRISAVLALHLPYWLEGLAYEANQIFAGQQWFGRL